MMTSCEPFSAGTNFLMPLLLGGYSAFFRHAIVKNWRTLKMLPDEKCGQKNGSAKSRWTWIQRYVAFMAHKRVPKKVIIPRRRAKKAIIHSLCFVAENRECLHNWFRAGGAYSANGCVEFMKECFARLPKRAWSIAVRADSAFFHGGLLDFLEEKGTQYLIKVKLKGLEILLKNQKWRKIANRPGFESTEFEFKCRGWKKSPSLCSRARSYYQRS